MGTCCSCCVCYSHHTSSNSTKTHTSQVTPVAHATQYKSPLETVKESSPSKKEPQSPAKAQPPEPEPPAPEPPAPKPPAPELVPPPPVTVEVTEALLTSILPTLEPSANPDQAPPPPPPPPPAAGPLAPPPPPTQGMHCKSISVGSYKLCSLEVCRN